MKRWFGVFVVLAAMPLVAVAEDVRARFTVSAIVVPHANLERVTEQPMLSVSEEDVARGYVDVAAVYRVQNNDPAGFMVRLSPRTGLTSSIEVIGLATSVVMRDEIVEVLQPAALRAQQLDLQFRLLLSDAAVPGTYAMPVHVAVSSL
jgi:hypothetical protein